MLSTLPRPEKKALLTYFIDFALTGVCSLLAFVIDRLPPFNRIVFIDDKDIQYPHQTSEMIPNWTLPFVCIVLPLLIVSTMTIYKKRTLWAASVAILGIMCLIFKAFACLVL